MSGRAFSFYRNVAIPPVFPAEMVNKSSLVMLYVYISMSSSLCVYIYIYIYIYICINTNIYIYIYIYTHTPFAVPLLAAGELCKDWHVETKNNTIVISMISISMIIAIISISSIIIIISSSSSSL